MTKHLVLTPSEKEEFHAMKKFQFCSKDGAINTWPEYHQRLANWTKNLRAKHKLDDKEPFTFDT